MKLCYRSTASPRFVTNAGSRSMCFPAIIIFSFSHFNMSEMFRDNQTVEASRRRKHKFQSVRRCQHHSNNVLTLSTGTVAFFLFHICVKIHRYQQGTCWKCDTLPMLNFDDSGGGGGGEINAKISIL